jgi:hypothetical protein
MGRVRANALHLTETGLAVRRRNFLCGFPLPLFFMVDPSAHLKLLLYIFSSVLTNLG